MLSEFYQLRRTAIKDLAAYIGFLVGFIGAAPLAWGLLSEQLASGSFVKGLWYFFGIVIAAGVFTGTIGLGLGYVGGVIWEHSHRLRRAEKLRRKAIADAALARPEEHSQGAHPVTPRLQLVNVESAPLPDLEGRKLTSIRFREVTAELDFSGTRLEIRGAASIICGAQRLRFPDAGSRDALCGLIGDTVEAVRGPTADRVEIHFRSGCDLVLQRGAVAVA